MGWSIIRGETKYSMRGADQRGFDVALECSTGPEPTVLGFLMLAPSADLEYAAPEVSTCTAVLVSRRKGKKTPICQQLAISPRKRIKYYTRLDICWCQGLLPCAFHSEHRQEAKQFSLKCRGMRTRCAEYGYLMNALHQKLQHRLSS